MYNRASADPRGRPWSPRRRYVWWDPQQKKWVGYDVPDFAATKPPTAKAQPNGIGLDAHDGADPFIMLQDGVGWLYVPSGLVDSPLPAHYEPAKSPVRNRSTSSSRARCSSTGRGRATSSPRSATSGSRTSSRPIASPSHYLAGAMSRWQP
jgi:formate dehydrogenase major subunit